MVERRRVVGMIDAVAVVVVSVVVQDMDGAVAVVAVAAVDWEGPFRWEQCQFFLASTNLTVFAEKESMADQPGYLY